MSKQCCGTSVGVLVFDKARAQMLMIKRGTLPAGIAPVAGHALDEHASYEAAAYAEVAEEIGLTVTGLSRLTAGGHHPGRCRRQGSTGHTWRLYEATVEGDLAPSEREVADVRWYPLSELQALADRTGAWAAGQISGDEFAADPGLEPVWVHWLHALGYVYATAQDRAAIQQLAATPPAQH
ncbi:NUDIX domain-containing protein [Nocardiopsis alba]|uniref:NUDIX domain-containing protein n=1 Tax=Nocardiopsis alba TaxID=53437 RepID=UPI003672336E